MTKARLDKAIMIATIEELNNATEAYDEGTPLMTDEEWDGKGAFMDYLRIKEMKFKKLEVEERLKKLKGDFK